MMATILLLVFSTIVALFSVEFGYEVGLTVAIVLLVLFIVGLRNHDWDTRACIESFFREW